MPDLRTQKCECCGQVICNTATCERTRAQLASLLAKLAAREVMDEHEARLRMLTCIDFNLATTHERR